MKTRLIALLSVAVFLFAVTASAHEMTVMGTVAKIEATRIQVKTGKEKAGAELEWYPIDETTKIKRGSKALRLADAKIRVDEKVVLIVDHPTKGPTKTKEIRLAAQ